jgi:4-methylaminobutanoate oxidase (formaldehyde-forming)
VLQGTLEADLTVTKIGPDDFMVVASDTAHRHVEAMMSRLAAGDVHITDVTGALAQINVQGPRSREILQQLTSHDLSNEVLRHAHQASHCTTAAHCMLGITLYCCTLHAQLFHLSSLLTVPHHLTPQAFPFRTASRVQMGFAEPLCARITYVGELGYELYVPVEQAVHVHSLVTEAGESHGLQHAVPRGTTAAASLTTAAASLTTAAASEAPLQQPLSPL